MAQRSNGKGGQNALVGGQNALGKIPCCNLVAARYNGDIKARGGRGANRKADKVINGAALLNEGGKVRAAGIGGDTLRNFLASAETLGATSARVDLEGGKVRRLFFSRNAWRDLLTEEVVLEGEAGGAAFREGGR